MENVGGDYGGWIEVSFVGFDSVIEPRLGKFDIPIWGENSEKRAIETWVELVIGFGEIHECSGQCDGVLVVGFEKGVEELKWVLEMGRQREGFEKRSVEGGLVGGVGKEDKAIGCRHEGFEEVYGNWVHM